VREQPSLRPHRVAVEGARRVVEEGGDERGLSVGGAVVVRVRRRRARRERHGAREHQAQRRQRQQRESEQPAQVVLQVGGCPRVRAEHRYDHAWAQEHRQRLRGQIR